MRGRRALLRTGFARRLVRPFHAVLAVIPLAACDGPTEGAPVVRWHVFKEPSGAFPEAAGAARRG